MRPGRWDPWSGPGDPAAPRIIVQNGEYWLRNNGDLAMLDVTVGRLRARWPQARIGVITDSPLLLRSYAPEAEAISRSAWPVRTYPEAWGRVPGRLGPVVGTAAVSWLTGRQRSVELLDRVRGRLTRHARALRRRSAAVSAAPPAPEQLLPGAPAADVPPVVGPVAVPHRVAAARGTRRWCWPWAAVTSPMSMPGRPCAPSGSWSGLSSWARPPRWSARAWVRSPTRPWSGTPSACCPGSI